MLNYQRVGGDSPVNSHLSLPDSPLKMADFQGLGEKYQRVTMV
jgi:hypothetical protein